MLRDLARIQRLTILTGESPTLFLRIRCMKFKRKSVSDNWRMRLKHLHNQGLLFLSEVRAPPVKECLARPTVGATTMASPGA